MGIIVGDFAGEREPAVDHAAEKGVTFPKCIYRKGSAGPFFPVGRRDECFEIEDEELGLVRGEDDHVQMTERLMRPRIPVQIV